LRYAIGCKLDRLIFCIAIGFWSAHERPTLGLPDQSDSWVAGDRWSLIVIRDLMFGNRRHFRELLTRSEERIASNILAIITPALSTHGPKTR
jgi:hypothetical protein